MQPSARTTYRQFKIWRDKTYKNNTKKNSKNQTSNGKERSRTWNKTKKRIIRNQKNNNPKN